MMGTQLKQNQTCKIVAAGVHSCNVTRLNLTGKDKENKIEAIGDLKAYRNLVFLNLSENRIEKIENLETLVNLKHLNIAGNRISKLEGLECCSKLMTLNVSFNLISSVPVWLAKKLVLLKSLYLAGNSIKDPNQLIRLQGLANLSVLSFHDNPATEQLSIRLNDDQPDSVDSCSTYRLFVLHHLPKIVVLDGQEVTPEQIQRAKKLFAHGGMRKILRSSSCSSSLPDRSKSDTSSLGPNPPSPTSSVAFKTPTTDPQQASRIEKLEQELRLKDNLLRTRSDELARACLKHFELEQELAFHKIDTKMAALLLGPRPKVSGGSFHAIDSTGEQPYLGRCRSRFLSTSLRSPRFQSNEHLPIRPCQSVDHLLTTPHGNSNLSAGDRVLGAIQDLSINPYQSAPKLLQSTPIPIQNYPTEMKNFQTNTELQSPDSSGPLGSPCLGRPRSAPLRAKRIVLMQPTCENNVDASSDLTPSPSATNRPIIPESGSQLIASAQPTSSVQNHQPQNDQKLYEQLRFLYSELDLAKRFVQSGQPATGPRCDNTDNHSGGHVGGQLRLERQQTEEFGALQPLPRTPDCHSRHDPPTVVRKPNVSDPLDLVDLKPDHVVDSGSLALTDRCHSSGSPPMQNSTTSSRPSSRTAGTGRSAVPSAEALVHQDRVKSDGSSSRVLSTGPSDVDRTRHSVQGPRLEHNDRERTISSTLKVNQIKKNLSIHKIPTPIPRNAWHLESDHSDGDIGETNKRTNHTRSHRHKSKSDHGGPRRQKVMTGQTARPNHRHSSTHLNLSLSSSDESSDSLSDGDSDPPGVMTRRVISHRPERVLPSDTNPSKRRSVRKAMRSVTIPNGSRSARTRPNQVERHYKDRVDAPLSDQAEQLLNLLVLSREGCAAEMRKMRTDLARVQNIMTGVAAQSDRSCSPRVARSASRGEKMDSNTRQLCYNRSGGTSRGTAHSLVDTWTTVTRPSPNELDEDDPFGSPDDFGVKPFPNSGTPTNTGINNIHNGRPRRMLPSTSGPDETDDAENIVSSRNRVSYACTDSKGKHPRSKHLESAEVSSRRLTRGRSLDIQLAGSARRRDHDGNDAEEPSTETAALVNLTEELIGLRQGLKRTRQANSNRLEMALKHISTLGMELQRQRCLTHEMKNAQERQTERARWERRLAATISELKQCQSSILELRAQMDSLDALKSQPKHSEALLVQQQAELNQTRAALDTQKEEISRLNKLLNRLLGSGPDGASSDDLAQIQTKLVELNRRMQPDMDQLAQPASVRRAQSWLTGLTSDADRSTPVFQPQTGFVHLANSSSGQFVCNVPEHHYLEDCMEELQVKLDDLEAQRREQEKKLNQSTKSKKKLQKRLEDQNCEIDRLNANAAMKREELVAIRAELRTLTESKQSEQNQQRVRLATLASDLAQIETTVSGRREELSRIESKLHDTEVDLRNCQTQLQDATAQRENVLREYRQSKLDLETVQSDLNQTKGQLHEKQQELKEVRAEVENVSMSKRQLQGVLQESGQTIRERETEFQRLTSKITEAERKLHRLETDLAAGERRLETQERNLAEQETHLREKQTEIVRLTQKIDEDQRQADSLKKELAEHQSALEQLKSDKKKQLDEASGQLAKVMDKAGATQRELDELRSLVKLLQEEKSHLTNSIETLKQDRQKLFSESSAANQESRSQIDVQLESKRRELKQLKEQIKRATNRLTELKREQLELTEHRGRTHEHVTDEWHETTTHEISVSSPDPAGAAREHTELRGNLKMKQIQDQIEQLQQKLTELKSKESDFLETIYLNKRELSKIRQEVNAESAKLNNLRQQRIGCQTEQDHLTRLLEQRRSELVQLEQQLSSAKSAVESHEHSLGDQRRERCQLNEEVNRLNQAAQLSRAALRAADEARETSESMLHTAFKQLDRTSRETRETEHRLNTSRKQLKLVDEELESKTARLNELDVQIKSKEIHLNSLGRTESRISELEQALAEAKRPQSTPIPDGSTNSQAEVSRLKTALAQAQRDLKQLKRRSTRDLVELERIAEEQCSRAGDLSEQLLLIKRQYAQLKGQISTYGMLMDEVITIASQTELSEHGKRLEAALSAARAELEQNVTHCLVDERVDVMRTESAPEIGQLEEPKRFHTPTMDSALTGSLGQLPSNPLANSRSMLLAADALPPICQSAGLYRPVDRIDHAIEVCESTVRTGMTTATSGLGSSLLPTTNGSIREGTPVPPMDEHTEDGHWKDQLANCVAKQTERLRVDRRAVHSTYHDHSPHSARTGSRDQFGRPSHTTKQKKLSP